MATKKQKAENVAAKLAQKCQKNTKFIFRGNTAPSRSIVRTSKDERLVAVMCPFENCGQEFSLKKKGDLGSYNIGGYSRHLEEVHDFHRPRPVEVWGY